MLNLAEDLPLPPTPAAKPALARSIATALLLAAQLITSLLLSAAHAQRLLLLARIRQGGSVAAQEFRASDFIIVGGSRLALPLTVATATAFLLWLYRVCENARVYRGDTLAFTPGESVRSFFIPIVNLIDPYKAVRELWLASDPAVPPLSRIDNAHRAGSNLVLFWWVLFLARGIPAWWAVVFERTASPEIEKLTLASYGFLASHLLSMPAALAAGALVYLVDQRQDALAAALERVRREEPPLANGLSGRLDA